MYAHLTDRGRRLRRLALTVLSATAIAVPTTVSGTAQAAAAPTTGGASATARVVPNSAGPRCGYGTSSGNTYTCITIEGSGLHVDHILATAEIMHSARRLQVCIRGPRGTVGCYPSRHTFIYVRVGTGIYIEWNPDSNEPGGDYCANTWRLNSDGSDTEIGHECANVHP